MFACYASNQFEHKNTIWIHRFNFRFFCQAIVTVIKNLIILNKSCFDGFSSLIIPSLLGIATALNPNETIQITANQASWLCKCPFYSIFLLFACVQVHSKKILCIPSHSKFHIYRSSIWKFAERFCVRCTWPTKSVDVHCGTSCFCIHCIGISRLIHFDLRVLFLS